MVPIFEIDISTPVKNTARPNITPTHPKKKFIKSLLETPTKKFNITTRIAIGITAFALFFISSIKIKPPQISYRKRGNQKTVSF